MKKNIQSLIHIFCLLCLWAVSSLPVSASNTDYRFMIDEILRSNGREDLSIEVLDSIVDFHPDSLDDESLLEMLRKQYKAYWKVGAYGKAAHAYELIERVNPPLDRNSPERLKQELDYASTLFYSSRYAEAYAVLYALLNQMPDDKRQFLGLKAEAYIWLANTDIRCGEIEWADENLKKGYDLIQLMPDGRDKDILTFRYLLGLSVVDISNKDYNAAYEKIKSAEKIGVEPESSPLTLKLNLAIIYDYLNNEADAESYYEKIRLEPMIHYNKCVAMNNYASFLLRRNRPEQAIAILEENIPILKTMEAPHALAFAYFLLAQAYNQSGDAAKAAVAIENAMTFTAKTIQEQNAIQHDLIYGIYENRELKRQQTANESTIKALLVTVGMLASILALAFVSILWRVMHRRKKSRAEREMILDLKCRELAANVRVEQIKSQLSSRNRELVAQQMRMEQIEREYTAIINEKPISKIDEEKREIAIKNIKSMNLTKNSWDKIKIYFEEIHPGFYALLDHRHPDLTRGEKRMCAFIIIGMNTAEIAQITNRSPRTVESVKYQLKKKLGLTAEDSLEKYLNSLKL